MDRYITKSKYFTPDFNTAIFSDPIRIYFSNEHESQALEIYFRLQKRKNEWERFLRKDGQGNYCYIMLYSEASQFSKCFEEGLDYSPVSMGDDYVVGINGPMDKNSMEDFMSNLDQRIGFSSVEESL